MVNLILAFELLFLRKSTQPYTGAYYYTQPQFKPPFAPAPIIMNPALQQQQAPQPQIQQTLPRRERKQIRIFDPNQGGRDVTEEIMARGRSGSTPTPPQKSLKTNKKK
ncbi:hypothetical protein G5714_013906 [Onychostoma macrolepis]|uniref:Uncharacterized protein n=1 Tax=Onychostoma macrolepis TaxID=369639 RepID=A0A7J6CD59_9TELE|nr:hypothetical protein G5714_013906 [Onychostoma macrolepis]